MPHSSSSLTHTLTGTFRLHKEFRSRFLHEPRNVIVYLPPGYNDGLTRYPVLYMHDGQNLFDSATAFLNQEWGVDELVETLIPEGQMQPVIIVGIYNTEMKRLEEYTPMRDQRGQGGRARMYGRLIIEDLKPFIDAEYRTLRGAVHTGMGGSSLGGLVSLYLGLQHPDTFGKLLVMSPSIWWAKRAILREVNKLPRKLDLKIWLDTGTCEGDNPQSCISNLRDLRDLLLSKGWQLGQDLSYVEDQGAGHDEKAWGFRMRQALTFLYQPRPQPPPLQHQAGNFT